ncbi:hypothetical protein [Litchfieldella rifensis]|uniref:Uncharacterized protein n=1 Tax=Litchfieldella rifensis TaxID=762643 RepID=A0ABV7LJW9_9GAMM
MEGIEAWIVERDAEGRVGGKARVISEWIVIHMGTGTLGKNN